ncbi:phosphoribosyl 1,2-cyclic phosphate phosphodiesterase [Pseudorhodobacter antarcticus]|uniref:Phosphoribosyl 1,2-cyclic phosphate phosphodiesterase n=1 Tax=Pseudorhodobacter antarcticus TaxID=1077947 RepID=A0A1H8FUF9_9RHOB|nr:MBL fold metallo-hydrolase [Pseudorhodobacter antarcticus]SEN35185.1 phosphoribosyl 1,2-cyclic phosphate phosphodiesterase [Pseudorhodobacter antarcticus]
MTATLRFTILGCGSSGGVPRLGGHWGDCDPQNPKNRRRRCSLLVERLTDAGTTRVLIDTSPDMRDQLLSANVGTLNGVVYTHAHADHVHGIDDLRQIVFNMQGRLPVWADAPTQTALMDRFAYVFTQAPNSPYPPILDLNLLDGPVTVPGPGGDITLHPFTADHGSMDALGFRIANVAYLPDAVAIPGAAWDQLQGLDVWIVDALRRKPHPTHAHLALTLDWIARAKPTRAILTNMHIDLDYQTLDTETPTHITPAYDGMVFEIPDT